MDSQSPKFHPQGFPTLIGSLPLKDHGEAMARILRYTPEIPLWPQLPGIPHEGMLNQFIEGFPGVVERPDKTYFDITSSPFEAEHLSFFENYLAAAEDLERIAASPFQITRERAAGIYHLAETVRGGHPVVALKGQITGPFTLLTGISDQGNRLGYYDPTIREIVVKGLSMRAAWQTAFLKQSAQSPVLLFIDEPALAGLGSTAFISIAMEDIAADIREVAASARQAGALVGVHVCANTDWNFILSLGLDIISFDAYGFFNRFITCKEQILAFLREGGIIAWGGVPTSEEEHIRRESADTLAALWEDHADQLAKGSYSRSELLGRMLMTPSCGTGSLPWELAERVLALTRDVSALLRKKYPFQS